MCLLGEPTDSLRPSPWPCHSRLGPLFSAHRMAKMASAVKSAWRDSKVLTVGPRLEANRREVLHDLDSCSLASYPWPHLLEPSVSPLLCVCSHLPLHGTFISAFTGL